MGNFFLAVGFTYSRLAHNKHSDILCAACQWSLLTNNNLLKNEILFSLASYRNIERSRNVIVFIAALVSS